MAPSGEARLNQAGDAHPHGPCDRKVSLLTLLKWHSESMPAPLQTLSSLPAVQNQKSQTRIQQPRTAETTCLLQSEDYWDFLLSAGSDEVIRQ